MGPAAGAGNCPDNRPVGILPLRVVHVHAQHKALACGLFNLQGSGRRLGTTSWQAPRASSGPRASATAAAPRRAWTAPYLQPATRVGGAPGLAAGPSHRPGMSASPLHPVSTLP